MTIKRCEVSLGPNSFFVKVRSKGQDVKVEVRPNRILIPKSKNGKPRTVPLSNIARGVFVDLLADEANSEYVFANHSRSQISTNNGPADNGQSAPRSGLP